MSNTIRQSNIFGGVDWKMAYESFLQADYTSYEYNSIYQSMVDYIKDNYPDEFNDYIRNSELMAHVNMLAYLGQNYAFRNDVNSKENFMDDAIRRESIIKIANTLTYKVQRNKAASGLLKISSLSTTENIKDSDGNNLSNVRIFWNQRGLPTWYDSFIKIIEATLNGDNRFGNPLQRSTIDGVRHEIYGVRQSQTDNYVYQFMRNINGTSYPFEIVPSRIDEEEITERHPSTDEQFSLVYKNNGKGNSDNNTGFFIQFKQGSLLKRDFFYTTPKIDRSEYIDIENINNTDVWVQEIKENGELIEKWHDVPNESGENIIYNSINLDNRTIYFSKTLSQNKVEILYGDGNFSVSPTKHMRVWVRKSANEKYKINKHDISDVRVDIPYVSNDGKPQTLSVYLTNEYVVDNADTSQEIEIIKSNIQADHYRQNRMVTIEDYNIFPFERNPLRKMRTLNRGNASKSRYPYIEAHDPTGLHSNSIVNGVDGYLFSEYYEQQSKFNLDVNYSIDENTITQMYIEPLLKTDYFKTFYMNDVFVRNFYNDIDVYTLENDFPRLYWNNKHIKSHNKVGNLQFKERSEWVTATIDQYSFMRQRSKLLFVKDNKSYWTTLISHDGDITLSDHVPTNAYLYYVVPSPSLYIDSSLKPKMLRYIERRESFGLRFDDITGKWIMISQDNILGSSTEYDTLTPNSPTSPDNRWLIKCIFIRDIDGDYYRITVRGSRLVFGSDKQTRFFFINTDWVPDVKTGVPSLDTINIEQDGIDIVDNELTPEFEQYVTKKNISINYLDDME